MLSINYCLSAAGVATIASDLGYILASGIPTMVAAILLIARHRTITHFVFALAVVCHTFLLTCQRVGTLTFTSISVFFLPLRKPPIPSDRG